MLKIHNVNPRPLGLSTHITRKQSFELRERLHSTQVSTVMTRKQSFENVNVLNAVKLRHSSLRGGYASEALHCPGFASRKVALDAKDSQRESRPLGLSTQVSTHYTQMLHSTVTLYTSPFDTKICETFFDAFLDRCTVINCCTFINVAQVQSFRFESSIVDACVVLRLFSCE